MIGTSSVPGKTSTTNNWYANLEKYWYYIYKLVNDFMFIEKDDRAGSSIPAQTRGQALDRPLTKLENYISKNKHLPNIPSAEEVAKDGIDVESMDSKLLQKIEELTLYVVQQQKALEQQQKEIEVLKT